MAGRRNTELEAVIASAPDCLEPCLVYQDWLQERGELLGDLIASQVAATRSPADPSRDALEMETVQTYMGRWPSLPAAWYADPQFVAWQWGFIRRLHLGDMNHWGDFSPLVSEALQVLHDPICQFARELVIYSDVTSNLWLLRPLRCLEKLRYTRNWVHFNEMREFGWPYDGSLTDAGPLSALTSLTDLELSDEPLSDISPLAGLTRLRRLNLYRTRVHDLTPLGGMEALEDLDLGSCKALHRIDVLRGLKRLRTLVLTGTAVRDISPLFELGRLEHVEIGDLQLDPAQLRTIREQVSEVEG